MSKEDFRILLLELQNTSSICSLFLNLHEITPVLVKLSIASTFWASLYMTRKTIAFQAGSQPQA